MWVKPTNPAVKVPDPAHMYEPQETYFLPDDGRNVGDGDAFYWARRIAEGDVVEFTPDAPAPPAPAPAP